VLESWEVKTLQRFNAALCDYKSEQLRKCSEQAGLIIEEKKSLSDHRNTGRRATAGRSELIAQAEALDQRVGIITACHALGLWPRCLLGSMQMKCIKQGWTEWVV
jgi:hypothetical protein